MTKSLALVVAFCVILSGSGFPAEARAASAPATAETWLVTTRDPHHLRELNAYIARRTETGRVLVVELKIPVTAVPAQVRKHLKRIALSEIRQYVPRLTERVQPDPRVVEILAQVAPDRIRENVLALSAHDSRSAGSRGNQDAVAWTKTRFEQMGYRVTQDCYRAGECNLIAEQLAAIPTGETVYVVAHLDSVGHRAAGADDNASGTSGALEIARVLAGRTSLRNIRYFITNGEENGLVGSKSYVQRLTAPEVASIRLAINMDMIAYNQNGKVDLETNAEFEPLARWFGEKTLTYTRLTPNITIPAWGSDHVPFLDRGVSTLLTIEHWETKTPCYHRACDKDETLNYAYAAEIVRLNVAATLEAAGVALR